MEVGIFLKQMTRSDLLSLDFFVCCYFGYFGLIYISSLKNKIHLQQNMLSHSKKKRMCNFKKFRVVFLESCLEIGLIINDLSLDSDWGHLLDFLEMPAILPNKLHTCMTSHYDIPHVNCTLWQNPKKCSTITV